VDAPAGGDEIRIALGVYTQQAATQNMNLTLTGVAGVVVRAWPGMIRSSQYQWYNPVEITAAAVSVQGIELQGELRDESMPAAHFGFAARYYGAASGQAKNCSIQGFRGTNGIASDVTLATNRFCQVSTPVKTEPLGRGDYRASQLHLSLLATGTGDCERGPAFVAGRRRSPFPGAGAHPQGPWTPLAMTPSIQRAEATFAVKTDGDHRFFRLK
jgi:hypothetical protein